jgi:hypothetical protein
MRINRGLHPFALASLVVALLLAYFACYFALSESYDSFSAHGPYVEWRVRTFPNRLTRRLYWPLAWVESRFLDKSVVLESRDMSDDEYGDEFDPSIQGS